MEKEYVFDSFRVIRHRPTENGNLHLFSENKAGETLRFHRSLPFYGETPLRSLHCTAEKYGVDSILVKDESLRFGLKAFKGLGGSYCMFRILCEKLGLDETRADFSTFLREDIRKACSRIEFATATDGNHGKGVSWAAGLFGCRAHVYMPQGSVEARRRAIEEAGTADAEITDLNYDETVQYAASLAEQHGWVLIQDTSWPEYENYPRWIVEGYLTMAAEAAAQMKGKTPTHLFLQAGVGAMAGGVEAYFMNLTPDRKPVTVIVEPTEAACIYRSAMVNDGAMHSIGGNPVTIMAGLNCGTPCGVVWPVLRDCTSLYCACEDSVTELGMRAYAQPLGTDEKISSGESGAVTYGLLCTVLESEQMRTLFQMDRNSVILLINTEGDTDPEGYIRVVGG